MRATDVGVDWVTRAMLEMAGVVEITRETVPMLAREVMVWTTLAPDNFGF